ncbi:hypothetical protein E5K00_17035 [Hymenobacter aquaticus]|uniref:DUF481 domain-containing protein n=1 Tax=Hymenobacter aquaticus TaxID=1867101 RepID=A0A4Z0PZS2_9BACT|nr:hypothetical protein [Hymenobacter aquaticus]TGE21962.1 hypothetical protein E5K00_17035 [Hymenobacter aquaticus]
MKNLSFAGVIALAFLALATSSAQAQRRTVGPTLLLPELQAEYALRQDDYLLLSVQGPTRTGSYDGTQLNQLGLRLGYERFWSPQWSGGGALRTDAYTSFQGVSDDKNLFLNITPELYLRHWNTFGAVNFRQRLGVEYTVPGEPLVDGRALARLRLDVDRVMMVGKLALRPRVAYEALAYLRFQREEEQEKERVIDFGSLRADLGIRVSPHVDVTPWVASNASYLFVLEQTDLNGNVTVPGGKANTVVPVVGLDLRYTLFRGGATFERRQLPTQH